MFASLASIRLGKKQSLDNRHFCLVIHFYVIITSLHMYTCIQRALYLLPLLLFSLFHMCKRSVACVSNIIECVERSVWVALALQKP